MKEPEYVSRLSKKQALGIFLWIPVHMLLLPFLLSLPIAQRHLSPLRANFLIYALGAAYMVLILRRFLRRDFDVLCDRPLLVLLAVFCGYWLSRFGEWLVWLLYDALSVSGTGSNNEAVVELLKAHLGPAAAMTIFLAPAVEESIFRAGIFGQLRHKSRLLAYLVSVAAFAFYHVWQFVFTDPSQLVYALQYVPAALVLAVVYDCTESIWASLLLHMVTNAVGVLSFIAS